MRILERRLQRGTRETSLNVSRAFSAGVEPQRGGSDMGTASAFDTRRIGWIGLGKMGLPICERVVAQGFEVATLTRNPEGRERAARANLQSESKISGVVERPPRRFRCQ